MNLYDLIRRLDRSVVRDTDAWQALEIKRPGGGSRTVTLPEGGVLILRGAHEFTSLRTFTSDPGWRVEGGGGQLLVELLAAGSEVVVAVLDTCPLNVEARQVRLDWPVPVPLQFDLRLRVLGVGGMLQVGPLFNPRQRILPALCGAGVEVGPGMNPAVLPNEQRSVKYVEKMSAEQWSKTYAKKQFDATTAGHWDNYVVDSAHTLSGFPDHSLGFVFSSHVIEHLVNPLGVFDNWWTKLAPGGAIAGVVPDALHTFDLRQPLTTIDELLRQRHVGGFEPSEAMYEAWCRYTAPENTPAGLRARDYSIHVNYYSPSTFRVMLDAFAATVPVASLYMESAINGKDFGFMIVKP